MIMNVNNNIKINYKDSDVLLALARCGYLTEAQFIKTSSRKRLEYFLSNSILERSVFYNLKAYKLSSRGKRMVKKLFYLDNFYHPQSIPHDIALAKYYLSLNDKEKSTWITETEMRFNNNSIKGVSYPDGCYIKDGAKIAIEVITSSTKKAKIDAKNNFCRYLNCKIIFIKAESYECY